MNSRLTESRRVFGMFVTFDTFRNTPDHLFHFTFPLQIFFCFYAKKHSPTLPQIVSNLGRTRYSARANNAAVTIPLAGFWFVRCYVCADFRSVDWAVKAVRLRATKKIEKGRWKFWGREKLLLSMRNFWNANFLSTSLAAKDGVAVAWTTPTQKRRIGLVASTNSFDSDGDALAYWQSSSPTCTGQ